jgi:pantothenate kinase
MPELLRDPVSHLLARLAPGAPRWMIGLVGMPGSGKSTLAARLEDELNARAGQGTLVALGMDGFHLPKAALRAMPNPDEAFARRGAPWTFDAAGLLARLAQLRAEAGREAVPWPGFEHEVGDPVEAARTIPPDARIVLVEGLYLLHDDAGWAPVARQFDERWFLDTPRELALERLALRHMRAWGFTRAQAEQRIATNDGLNGDLVLRGRERADWLVE